MSCSSSKYGIWAGGSVAVSVGRVAPGHTVLITNIGVIASSRISIHSHSVVHCTRIVFATNMSSVGPVLQSVQI